MSQLQDNLLLIKSQKDNYLLPGNLKSGVTCLGVTGTLTELKGETKTITPTTSQQTITPSSGKNGITQATVEAVTNSIDANITSGNIKKDVTILGVTGTYEGSSSVNNQNKTVTPTTSQQSITADSGYTGLGTVTVNAVTSAIDQNIVAGNIKKDVAILGVTGNYEGGGSLDLTTGVKFAGSTFSTMPSYIENANWSSLTNAYGMFKDCYSLSAIPLLDTSNITNASQMFLSCISLTTVPLLDISSVTNASQLFGGCSRLTTIPLLDTSSVTDASYIVSGCTRLTTIPLWDTSEVTTTQSMFSGCSGLQSVPALDLSSNTNMQWMFNSCSNLETIPVLNTSLVTNMNDAFKNCNNLTQQSLNNILEMCISATLISTKTLKYIGLSSTQAAVCETLSNWSASMI